MGAPGSAGGALTKAYIGAYPNGMLDAELPTAGTGMASDAPVLAEAGGSAAEEEALCAYMAGPLARTGRLPGALR